ncbi:MAG: porin [Chthoniobacteraceae bacterium]
MTALGAAATLAGLIATPHTGIAGETIETKDGKDAKKVEDKPRFTISGWVEGGFTGNFNSPADHQNFSRLFDDRSNEPMLNQAVITFERTLDPKATGFDWGFKAQVMFGTDARFIHSMGLLDQSMKTSIYQPDVVEAYLNFHFPVLTSGGVDVKVGKFVTLEGAETIDPRSNIFYSHSYIFNYGIPFNHTGILTTTHLNKVVDIYAGITRGVNTSVEDNNGTASFHGGFGLNFNDGKFVVAATTSIGAETPGNSRDIRYLNDITATWKITDKFTSITDVNYIYDEAADARGYGVAQYFTYAFNDKVSAGVRAEVWRDEKGFYVTSFADSHDSMRGLNGQAFTDARTVGGGSTTYGALTVGMNLKPTVPKPFSLTIRPEVRVDTSLNNTRPFNNSSNRTMLTAALDFIVTF